MSGKTWGIIGAVVVLAAAGATAALSLRHGGSGDYTSLPTCDQLSGALPGKPALKVGENVTHAADVHGLHPGFSNIRCEGAADVKVVEVDLYQPSNLNPLTADLYPDKQTHDGAWRAKDILSHHGLKALTPDLAYSTSSYDGFSCSVEQVKKNADVTMTVRLKVPADQFAAQCEKVAMTEMPKVIDAAL